MVGGPGGDDQVVIGNRAIAQDHAAVGRVEIDGFAEQHFGVAMVLENDTQGRGDFAGREPAGGHLVEQGLEEVEVAAIDQGDRYRRAAQRLGNIQPAKSAADDDYPMQLTRVGLHSYLDALGRQHDSCDLRRRRPAGRTPVQRLGGVSE